MSEQKKTINYKKYLDLLVRGLRHLFLHNALLKVIAVCISLVLWAGLISQDETVTRDKTFQNVSVNVTGAETLKNSQLIVVSDLDEILKDVSVVAAVPQKQYENADASAYNIRLDLSKIKGTGKQEVKLQSNSSGMYGRVTSINPATVTLDVENSMTRARIPVSVPVEGEIPEGWNAPILTANPTLVSVNGPVDLVAYITKAEVKINTSDIEWKEGHYITSGRFRLINQYGKEVDDPLISVTTDNQKIDNVTIEMDILPKVTIRTEELVALIGDVPEGYSIRNIRCSPETITIAARQDVLENIDKLISVNVDTLKYTTIQQCRVQKPSSDAILYNETVTVTVEIEGQEP